MSRVIHSDSAARRRNYQRRTAAELLRRLSLKTDMDEETRDMLAMLIYCLREIDANIEQSAAAWEKRDFWLKAERLRQRWHYIGRGAERLQQTLLAGGQPAELAAAIATLLPHFRDIRVNRYTRRPELWRGCYRRLQEETG